MSDEFLALERQADALERQADAFEAIATETRYQNALLCELVVAMDDLSARVDDHHFPESTPRNRSGRGLQRDIQDRLFDRDRTEDEYPEFRWGAAENWRGDDA